MNTPTVEQIVKLPKWAQDYIKDLQCKQTINERTMEKFQNDQTKSAVYIDDSVYVNGKAGPQCVVKYLQTTGVTFVMDAQKHHEIRVSHRYDSPGVLDISGGWGDLLVKPVASNYIRLFTEK